MAQESEATASPLRLLDWQVPDARHRYTRRDTAFYALSLGVGAQADDIRQVDLVDPWSERLRPLPSQALVLGYPGFWLGEPGVRETTGITPAQILHVEQSVELVAPLPAEGEVVGMTRVTALVDKGADRGSLLHSERRIVDAASGAPLAVCRQVHFLRKMGGFGSVGSAPDARRAAPQGEASHAIDTPTLQQQALLYRLNGDANPLHSDYALAAKAGFPRPILHGMCTYGITGRILVERCCDGQPERLYAMNARFTKPVLPGDSLTVQAWREGDLVHFRTLGADGAPVIDHGIAKLRKS